MVKRTRILEGGAHVPEDERRHSNSCWCLLEKLVVHVDRFYADVEELPNALNEI